MADTPTPTQAEIEALIRRAYKAASMCITKDDAIIRELATALTTLQAERDAAVSRAEAAEGVAERFRDTNRRLNRRLQLLEGWWQRRVQRAENWRQIAWSMLVRDSKDTQPDMDAIAEAHYQRGFEDGYDQKFIIPPRRRVKARAALSTDTKGE